jgi:serine/threonine protein kinase
MVAQASNKIPVVMISSTARDLPEYREQASAACLASGMQPCMMEHLAALDSDSIRASLEMVDKADVYIGLFAHRYGYVPEGHDISITEMEYQRAVEHGIPRLILLIDDDVPILPKDYDRGEVAVKLERLKERLKRDRVVGFFKNPYHLRALLIQSLEAHLKAHRDVQEPKEKVEWFEALERSLGEHYKIKDIINSGEIAVLYRAEDTFLRRQVAIRALPPNIPMKKEDADRIDEEVVIAASLKHRSLIKVYAARFSEEPHYLIMEFIEGATLKNIIGRIGRQPLRRIQKVLREIGEAVAYLHRKNIIHRKIRSSNIIIDDEGVAILEPFRFLRSYSFGLVREDSEYYIENRVYRSPEEEFRGEKPSEKSDQYSLGVVAYELILGKLISEKIRVLQDKINFINDPDPDGQLRSSCPPEVAEAILRMLQKNPDDRFPTIRHATAAIDGSSLYDLDEQQVSESYRRCCAKPIFIEEFYKTLFSKCEEIKQIFEQKGVTMGRQYAMLRYALDILVDYPYDRTATLPAIASKHKGLDHRLYGEFIEALIDTVRRCDPRWVPDLEDAWRERINEGIMYYLK